ncbi:nitroreductase family protein [Citreicella sp. C3M06]|uniref:nitroreductase family protein n=1 Tax=Citreicella sp. C3M06 TaxID=2841564 RepID=UPI001C0971A3|nr:nitroreductase family protein [Citreicella sp. C3M06]MBU2960031.1 nitroreductase family protein [Citreicella sp. C3M06]
MSLKSTLNRLRRTRPVRIALCWVKAIRWCRYYVQHSGAFPRSYNATASRAWIMREAHTVEKGLSLPQVRRFFGKAKTDHLRREMTASLAVPGNAPAIAVGQSVLASYVDWHRDQGATDPVVDNIAAEVAGYEASRPDLGGTIPNRPDVSDDERALYDRLVSTRRSVRNYAPGPVDPALLQEAIDLANLSPSVCNRQPWAVAVVQDPDMLRRMLSLQAGNKGFDHTIHNLLVVLADTTAFVEEYELFEPFVDAGIFSGALVNALNARNIGSCCLNLCVSHKMARKVIGALGIDPRFYPVMMISCGPAAEDCTVPISARLQAQTFHF